MAREALETGAVIDGFLIGEKLHTGGMATLWRVTKPGIDAPIVMKVPMIMDGDDATIIVGFEMEMMILPRLAGVHVPKCYGVGDYARQPYVTMEYIEGRPLLERLDEAPLLPQDVGALGAKIAAALVDLLEAEFQVPMGTGPYISPEQLLKNRTDPRSDIFSLGVLLYHFATKIRPFGYPQSQHQLRKRLWLDPVPPRKLRPDIPAWLQEIILRCLEPDPKNRYPTAAQLLFDLQHPDQVKITARGERLDRDGFWTSLKRWFHASGIEAVPQQPEAGSVAAAPIVMAAVDLSDGMEHLAEALRQHVARILATMPDVRLACVNVLKLNRIALNYSLDEEGRNIHVQRLVELKEWARPLGLDKERITFHVLEHSEPAQALLEFIRVNNVDQVLIGARGSSTLRRYLGSVSSAVVAESACTVTVVRVPAPVGTVEAVAPEPEAVAG